MGLYTKSWVAQIRKANRRRTGLSGPAVARRPRLTRCRPLLPLLFLFAVLMVLIHKDAADPPAAPAEKPQLSESRPASPSLTPPGPPGTNAASANVSASNSVAVPRPPSLRGAENSSLRAARNGYEAQLALARRAISPGCLDGAIGSQTRAALRAFQEKEHLPVTGQLDAGTKARLLLTEPTERTYTVTSNDLARLHPVGATWLAKSMQPRLEYETILELAAEKGWAHPNLIRLLNPSVTWTNVTPGAAIFIPKVEFPPVRFKAAWVRIRLADRILQAFDENHLLLAHFPCSIARQIEKRPQGDLFVEKVASYPTYRFDPEIFPESPEARRLGRVLLIPPGPNNPVGSAWVGLNRPGYGIHGTPRPEDVGRTESHGCFRLANWNAEYLAQLVRVGTRVSVEP